MQQHHDMKIADPTTFKVLCDLGTDELTPALVEKIKETLPNFGENKKVFCIITETYHTPQDYQRQQPLIETGGNACKIEEREINDKVWKVETRRMLS